MSRAKLKLTAREVAEIKHCLFYAQECAHGTAGHNQLMLIAKLAAHLGFALEWQPATPDTSAQWAVPCPEGVEMA